ncbi:DUF3179 domain-containing (seleno)protein [Halalkalirubrum salinum]|uniref:DUF3179 domain-containing (seleno)protein n=1 Tax=Halalkalirubrum salinum TaxID=2563889 RepID=UPI0010FB3B0C|nr:DUF3179 domain-containing (seleno)protein [Halalkalirubrum salinum]
MDVISVLPKDAIASIDEPRFDRQFEGTLDETILAVERELARAYPILILNYHEIVNDRVDDEPIAVTWCPICGSAVVYEATVGDAALTFGVSGKLADVHVLYDRETEPDWKQTNGECITGDLLGEHLTVIPAAMTTALAFEARYPERVFLQPTLLKY